MVGDQARRNENNPHSVDPPHQTSDQIFKEGRLDRTSGFFFWGGGCWGRGGVTFFKGGVGTIFREKINSNMEYLLTKKFINKNSLFCCN